MRRFRTLLFGAALAVTTASAAEAQQVSPRIGPFVVDVRAVFPNFPSDTQLADSRGLSAGDLPGFGFGLDVGAHLYFLKWRAITFGVGGELITARAHADSVAVPGLSVTERYTSLAPQISFNFGSSKGWSYISGGIGGSTWSIVPNTGVPTPADEERLKTLNYGGGARWFSKKHVAFAFDVRFYAINPGTPYLSYPGSPRTTLLVIGAGIAVR